MEYINNIIDKSVKDIESIFDYETIIIRDLSDKIHEDEDEDPSRMNYVIKTNKIPLLYFFDEYINKNINISIETRDKFLNYFVRNIYTISDLNRDHIININIDRHAIILYPFVYNGRYYIYLSNSGLGINNQNTNKNTTSCKLFHIIKLNDINKIYAMFLLIKEILELIQGVYPYEYLNSSSTLNKEHKKKLYENLDELWKNIFQNFLVGIAVQNVIDENFLLVFFTNILSNMQNSNSYHVGYIDLIYIILNYFAQIQFMNECTFNHVLEGNDHPKYIELIYQLIYNKDIKFTFNELYLNCLNEYNTKVYDEIRHEIDVKLPTISNDFINDINHKLDECAKLKKTIAFKRSSIILELYNSGLYNYVQVGGSCVFYCFYNLLINKLFLTNYTLYQTDKDKAIDNVISPLINIHYILLRHLCICNDSNLLNSYQHFFPNQIFHMNYIYNIMIENNLQEEINEFYPSPNLMIFSKTPLIDKLLDFTLNDDIFNTKKDIQYYTNFDVAVLNNYFNEIDLLINNYLYNIRNLSDLNVKSLITFRNKLYAIYNKLSFFFERRDLYSNCLKYLYISKDIIIVYCYYLRKIYSKESFFKKYIKKDKQIRVLFPVFSYPDYITTDNCGASEDCSRKKCTPQVYNCFYTYNIDYILNKFNSFEINAISVLLKNFFDIDIKNKITKLFKLIECNNFKVGAINITQYDFYNNSIYLNTDNNIRFEKDYKIFMKGLISKYFRNKYISINTLLSQEQRNIHKHQCNYIIEKLKDNIKSIADCSSLSIFKISIYDVIKYFDEINFNTILQILLFILSNAEYLFLSEETCTDNTFFNMMTLINKNTEIMHNTENKYEFIIQKIYYLLTVNTKSDVLDNSVENHSHWISKYNIMFDGSFFKYDTLKYVYNLKILYNNSISIILARFGIHAQNSDEYILLIPNYFLERDDDYFLLQSYATFTFFICIKKNKTIIEININEDAVDKNNCYLLKNEKRHKLIFDIQYPFLSFFTETTPYLCYTYNNTTYVDIIVSSAVWSLTPIINYGYLLYKKNFNVTEYNYQFDILEFEIANSLTFPTIKTNSIKYIENIHRVYPSSRILKFNNEQLILKDILIDYTYIDIVTSIIKNISKILCKNINCDEKTNVIFKEVFEDELTKLEQRNAVLESFLKENRLCIRFDFNDEIISIQQNVETELKKITDSMIVKHNFNKPNFIIDNLSYIITIMEINLLLNELFKINSKTSCWDIQLLLTKLDTILYFNQEMKLKTYYLYELLYLFQNNYFFKENQITKYRNILNDVKTNNSSLTIHQFMMGKGKTSFLTPLLSIAIYLLTGKSSIVITTEHLIFQTMIFMNYIHYLGDLPINVVTDYDYKHFWLNKTDINLRLIPQTEKQYKLDINNTSLIIDEFNSHYDYTTSMFNLVKKQEYISEDMFNYIFDYVHSKLLDKQLSTIDVSIIKNYELFNKILDKEFSIAKNLKYNEKYGFNYEGDMRLCIPYSRKDTPLIGSRFSSIILTIILTLNYYISNQNYKLDEDYDYPLIVQKYSDIMKLLPSVMFDEWYEHIQTNKKIDINIIDSTFKKLYSNLDIYLPILKKYLYIVNKPDLVFATEQYNLSFQDIIYNVYPEQWKIGYTGTIYLNPDIYFKDDTFVFKNKIEDFDERIEVKLALKGYGSSIDWNNNVIIINTQKNTLVEQLQIILSNGINRGIVDIGGLFIDYKNINIAKELQTLLPEKKIVYISEQHIGLEYDEHNYIKYKSFYDNNFYYYDQCHIVGTDLDQPNEGYIAVIINEKTKWTEFSQGIFRFRKLNRGTYLKIVYIVNSHQLVEKSLTNDDILEIIEKNESLFEKAQELGIKFQLMKTMVRKISNNYLEDQLLNDFLLENPITSQDCITFIMNNIKDINSVFKNEDNPYLNYINSLYNDIISNKDFISLVIGSNSTQKQIHMDIIENKNIQTLAVSSLNYDEKVSYEYDIITHLSCPQCIRTTSVPLFLNDFICNINSKPIYISINIALGFNSSSQIDTTLLIFVELPKIMLLEIEYIAYDYYSHKVPIYNFNGKLINTFLKNSAIPNPFDLDIDYQFLYLFNITNYINPLRHKNQYIITKSIINDIELNVNIEAVKIIFFLNKNLPNNYKDFFENIPIIQFLIKTNIPSSVIRLINIVEKDNGQQHLEENRLDNLYFDRFNNRLLRIPFQIIYDTYYHRLELK